MTMKASTPTPTHGCQPDAIQAIAPSAEVAHRARRYHRPRLMFALRVPVAP